MWCLRVRIIPRVFWYHNTSKTPAGFNTCTRLLRQIDFPIYHAESIKTGSVSLHWILGLCPSTHCSSVKRKVSLPPGGHSWAIGARTEPQPCSQSQAPPCHAPENLSRDCLLLLPINPRFCDSVPLRMELNLQLWGPVR